MSPSAARGTASLGKCAAQERVIFLARSSARSPSTRCPPGQDLFPGVPTFASRVRPIVRHDLNLSADFDNDHSASPIIVPRA